MKLNLVVFVNDLSNIREQKSVLTFSTLENPCNEARKELLPTEKNKITESTAKNEITKSLPLQSSKVKFFMKWAGLDLLALTASGIGNIALASSNICVHQYMPKWLADNLNNLIYPHHLIREIFTPNSIFLKMSVVAPITEELQYRLVIQEFLLKQLPKKILGKISPTHVDLVDSKVAKCARVVISSLLFALPHYISPEFARHISPLVDISCILSNRVFNAFGMGLILGSIQEITGDIAYPIIAHMLHNSIPALGMQLIGQNL